MENDPELMLGFKQEMFCIGDSACTCNHSDKAHKIIEKAITRCTGSMGPNFNHICNCKKYHPKDNLKFLEHQYKEHNQNG